MSTAASSLPAAGAGAFPAPADASARTALRIGLAGITASVLVGFLAPLQSVATGWLVGLCFWTAASLGFLLLIMILHVFDAMWATALRRQLEHATVAFLWLGLLFVPLFLVTVLGHRDTVWGWMSPSHIVMPEHKAVGHDLIYAKKSGFLNMRAFFVFTFGIYLVWAWLGARLRSNSVAQDADGDRRWTHKNRFISAYGIPLTGLSLTGAAIYWMKSLEYHWFSTMYGVWYFADSMRIALALGVLLMIWLTRRGDFQGIINRNHWHSIGQLMLAFTVFWGYIVFSQYFLIWNANVPEETFWYNEREFGFWYWVGMFLVFGNFLFPFLTLLSYRFKVTPRIIGRIAAWILGSTFIDLCWNILPAIKDVDGNARPFFGPALLVAITAVIGIGGICIWAYLRRLPSTKLIPIRDPRIVECLTHHDEE